MQDVDYLLKKIGYNDDPERTIYLLELSLKAIKIPSPSDLQKENLSPENKAQTFNFKPISKEDRQQKLTKIIEKLHLRYHHNDLKMSEMREKIIPMADAHNPEKAKLWQEFYHLEDEQTSIDKLIEKIKNLL